MGTRRDMKTLRRVVKLPRQSNLVFSAKPKWEVKVYVVLRLPVYTQKVPVFGMDWHQTKGGFQVRFGFGLYYPLQGKRDDK